MNLIPASSDASMLQHTGESILLLMVTIQTYWITGSNAKMMIYKIQSRGKDPVLLILHVKYIIYELLH